MAGRDDASRKPHDKLETSLQTEPEINWKQVMGCLSATMVAFTGGVSLSYTSALFPALQAPDSEIPSTPEDCAWLASSTALFSPLGAILSGFIMEHFGRLVAIQITVLPYCIAWIIIATAHSFTVLLIARIMMGAVYNFGITAAFVLVTETALKKHRGALSSVALALHAFGILCGYTLGAFLDWRTFAWVSVVSPLVPFVLGWIFTAESPLWLRSRGKTRKAERSSLYYYGDCDYAVQTVVTAVKSADGLENGQKSFSQPSFLKQLWLLVTLPSGYKPLIILNVMYILMNWSGIFIIMVNSVTFFQAAGGTIDPYYATIMVGAVRFVASCITICLLRYCRRRVLMLVSSISMAVSMAASAYATQLASAERGGGSASFFPWWFPESCIAFCGVAATIGMQTIPMIMGAELFPQQVRGAAQSINSVLSNLITFSSLQAYPWMLTNMDGAVGMQYFFAAVSLLAAVVTLIFFPETHGKSLAEIEDYFEKNTIYLGHKK